MDVKKPTLVKIDPTLPGSEQPTPLHNRWHPDIPPVRSRDAGVAIARTGLGVLWACRVDSPR